MSKTKAIPPEVKNLADQIGEFIEFWGFKRVHGRIWAHLVLSKHPLDAADIMKRLSISKALVSMSLNDLLKFDVIKEAGKSDRGTQWYVANSDFMGVILGVLEQRERKMFTRLVAAHKMVRQIPASQAGAFGLDTDSVKQVGQFIEAGSQALEKFISRLQFDLSSLR